MLFCNICLKPQNDNVFTSKDRLILCTDSGTEEMMKKVKKIKNYKEMIEDMLNDVKR